jgi:hypothetical protein
LWRSVLGGAGFSLRVLNLSYRKPPQAKAHATKPSDFRGGSVLASLQCEATAGLLLNKLAT